MKKLVLGCLGMAPLLVACPAHGPKWPATLPTEIAPTAVDRCVEVAPQLDDGAAGVPMASHAPSHAKVVAARCEDASVCLVELTPQGRARVHPQRAGSTFVDLVWSDSELPARDRQSAPRRGEGKVKVTFQDLPPAPPAPRISPDRGPACPPLAADAAAPWPGPALP